LRVNDSIINCCLSSRDKAVGWVAVFAMVYKNEKVASENRFWESSFQHFLPIRRKIKLA
jgi:hypothetical protein